MLATGGPGRRFFVEVKRGPEIVPALRSTLERAALGEAQITLMSFDLETVRARAKNGVIPAHGAISVSTPGALDSCWTLHQR